MSRLPVLTGKEVLKVALRLGFEIRRQKGSHLILRKGGRLLVIPMHSNAPIKKGTLLQILKAMEISGGEFGGYF
jgi:predicted RNA binding protein YcfA (HicA-like mRNA interferase family)